MFDVSIVDSIPSTHNLLSRNPAAVNPYTLLVAIDQTAGRGQRGNHWEAEPGCNLTYSLRIQPKAVTPAKQFLLSEAFALAHIDMLAIYGIHASIKWPNDIYVDDKKICGILIEHKICGSEIETSILSAGLNVNQTIFRSDAPNPVSIAGILGHNVDWLMALTRLQIALPKRLSPLTSFEADSPEALNLTQSLHQQFLEKLYRGDGNLYRFADNKTDEEILARIYDIAPDGTLTLQLPDNSLRRYLFKEVSFII